jgi:hypothetical protein
MSGSTLVSKCDISQLLVSSFLTPPARYMETDTDVLMVVQGLQLAVQRSSVLTHGP